MVSGIGPRTILSLRLLQWTRQVRSLQRPKEKKGSADAASTVRPGILKQEGGRSQSDPSSVPAASDASAAAADDNFGHLPKVSFADDDPASAPAGASAC